MRWLFRKFGALMGAAVAGTAGAGASQTMAYTQAYLQRLGGHIDETRHTLAGIRSGSIGEAIRDDAARQQLVDSFSHRLAELEAARDAIGQAGAFARPWQLATHLDPAIAGAALEHFTPSVPLDTPSIVFTIAGIVVGWTLWDIAGWPVRRAVARRQARQHA
jgi:hypothetical protein